eukprot:9761837-Ditylum_brightwellii.AAC.1
MGTFSQHPQMLRNLLNQAVDAQYWTAALNDGRVHIATDGLVATKKGYFEVIFHTEERTLWFQSPCDCHQDYIMSYQTKLAGILGAFFFSKVLSDYTGTTITANLALF